MEGYSLGVLTALGIRLSEAGIGDYWDDVDQLRRNQLIEGQLARADLLEKIPEFGSERPSGSDWYINNRGFNRRKIYPGEEVTENVTQRTLGNYAAYDAPTCLPNAWIMQCCTGNGTQGLYYAWEGIVRCTDGHAQVNLLLNRASQWLDVDSYVPYEGKVVIRNKTASHIAVRVPSWIPATSVRTRVNDEDRRVWWTGRYLQFEGLVPADAITLDFPVIETTQQYVALPHSRREQVYTCTFRGNTLVDIAPRDKSPMNYPLYLRDHLKGQEVAPMRTMERYVAPKPLLLW